MAKKLKTQKFFSREILPKAIADKGQDAVDLFERDPLADYEDKEKSRQDPAKAICRAYWRFKEGDEVVHKFNLGLTLIVQEVRYKRSIGVNNQERKRLDGIICHFWQDDDN
jgi:hypothetical protein